MTPIDFVRAFIREWEATWVDPDEVNHEWSELYAAAKEIVRRETSRHEEPN